MQKCFKVACSLIGGLPLCFCFVVRYERFFKGYLEVEKFFCCNYVVVDWGNDLKQKVVLLSTY